MTTGTIKKLFLASEVPTTELNGIINSSFANQSGCAITYLKKIEHNNYYCYVIFEDVNEEPEITRKIEDTFRSKNISSFHWEVQ